MRKSTSGRAALMGLAAFALFAPSIQAAMVVYANEAAFVAASGATLHALPSGVNATSITTVDNQLTLSTVGLAPGTTNMITDWATYSGANRLAGVEMAISGTESFNSSVTLSADRYAFGFGIYESTDPSVAGCNTTCTDSIFTITLKNNGSTVGTFNLAPADNLAVFWGVHTDFAFDAIEIRETTGSNDNEVFGTFYTGTRPAPVPLPAAAWLMLSGLGALSILRRRKAA